MSTNKSYVIPFKGYKVGVHELEFPIDDALLEAVGDEEMIGAEAVAKVTMTKGANMLTLDVVISGEVKVECDRCLDELRLPVEIEDSLVVKFSEEEVDFDGEVLWLNPSDGELDLARWLYETVLLALPYQRVHESLEECNPQMVARFQIVSEEEFDRLAEPTGAMAEGEMAEKLAALKRQMEEEKEN